MSADPSIEVTAKKRTPPSDVGMRRGRSRVTNGKTLLPDVDGRSVWARRCRDVMAGHIADLGGDDAVSEAERSIVRRAATLTVELERLEQQFANAGKKTKPETLAAYVTAANALRRLLETVGLRRRERNVTPDLRTYLDGRAA